MRNNILTVNESSMQIFKVSDTYYRYLQTLIMKRYNLDNIISRSDTLPKYFSNANWLEL